MQKIKAMVVDDEQDVGFLFELSFNKEIKKGEISFHYANSGEEALSFLTTTNASDIVLILSDINMPGMNGLELCKAVKEKYSHLKVYMITAYGDEYNREQAIQNGCDDYLTKPIDFKFLKSKIFETIN